MGTDIGSPLWTAANFSLFEPCAKNSQRSIDFKKVSRYLTEVVTTLSSKGQIVLPVSLRRQDRIDTGQRFAIHRVDEGQYLLQREEAGSHAGMVDWLLECPFKDWFQPIESETTDSL